MLIDPAQFSSTKAVLICTATQQCMRHPFPNTLVDTLYYQLKSIFYLPDVQIMVSYFYFAFPLITGKGENFFLNIPVQTFN